MKLKAILLILFLLGSTVPLAGVALSAGPCGSCHGGGGPKPPLPPPPLL